MSAIQPHARADGSLAEVFFVFLKLGLEGSSFWNEFVSPQKHVLH